MARQTTKWPKLPDNLGGKNQAGIQKDIGTAKEGAIRGMTALMVREQIAVKGSKEATGAQRNRTTKEDGIKAANCFLLLKAIMALLGGLILGQ